MRRCWSARRCPCRTTTRSDIFSSGLSSHRSTGALTSCILNAFVRGNLIREGEEHAASAIRAFESDGLDASPIRDAWRAARAQRTPAPRGGAVVSDSSAAAAALAVGAAATRASVAVMPFNDVSSTRAVRGGMADALAHDVITRLAKLRSLFVIAQGTVFALHERHVGAEEAGRILNVDYVTSGTVRRQRNELTVTVELTETRTARIVWADTFHRTVDTSFDTLEEIGDSIVASVDSEIEASERTRAVLKPPSSLNAWEAHHRGLWHMYRFNKADNDRAAAFFCTRCAARSDVRARTRRLVVHALSERVPRMGAARRARQARAGNRGTESHGRRPRPGRALVRRTSALAERLVR